MLQALLKTLAYRTAPRATFAALHPKRAVQLKALPFEFRHGLAPRLAALAGAAVALPAGVLLGIALEQSRAAVGPRHPGNGAPAARRAGRRVSRAVAQRRLHDAATETANRR